MVGPHQENATWRSDRDLNLDHRIQSPECFGLLVGQGKARHSVSGTENYRFGTRFNSEPVQHKAFEIQS